MPPSRYSLDTVEGSEWRFPELDDVFLLRATLVGIKPAIWRRFLVPKTIPLQRLHMVLQLTMGWTNSHLHQFKVGDLLFGEPDAEYPEANTIDYRTLELRHIAPRRGSRFVYEYDFGDSWEHLIEVEDELPAEAAGSPLPRCLEGQRACPPEDCGGLTGYRELLRSLRRRTARTRDGRAEQADATFESERFDVHEANARLARSVRSAPARSRRHPRS